MKRRRRHSNYIYNPMSLIGIRLRISNIKSLDTDIFRRKFTRCNRSTVRADQLVKYFCCQIFLLADTPTRSSGFSRSRCRACRTVLFAFSAIRPAKSLIPIPTVSCSPCRLFASNKRLLLIRPRAPPDTISSTRLCRMIGRFTAYFTRRERFALYGGMIVISRFLLHCICIKD